MSDADFSITNVLPKASVSTGGGFVGQAWLQTQGAQLNAMAFLTRQIIAGQAFAAVVQVQSVTNDGGVAPVGMVSVQPMVNQIDGLGNQVPHGTVYNLPYFRLQGGANAIIIDPQVNDIGIAVICDRDISNVKVTGKVSGPGSFRQNDWADGCYIGGFLNGTPTQYLQFNGDGVWLTSPVLVTVTAPQVNVISDNIRLGTTGGRRVVLDGDPVTGGSGGTVSATSTDVWGT